MNEFTLLELVFFLGLSFVLGAFVGIQKDIPLTSKGIFFWKKNQLNDDFAGIRSFWLIALFGAIMQFLDQIFGTLVVFTLWGFILTAFFINIDYIYSVFKREKHSPASELSSVLVYFFWVLIFSWQQEIAIILAISISIIISAKQILSLFLEKVSRDEVNTTLKYFHFSRMKDFLFKHFFRLYDLIFENHSLILFGLWLFLIRILSGFLSL